MLYFTEFTLKIDVTIVLKELQKKLSVKEVTG